MDVLIVDKRLCTKSGACVASCPAVFEFGPEGYARVKDHADTTHPGVEEAMLNCTAGAIYWE